MLKNHVIIISVRGHGDDWRNAKIYKYITRSVNVLFGNQISWCKNTISYIDQ